MRLFFILIIEGRRHDAAILRMSGLYDELERHSWAVNGDPLCVYGDTAYPLRIHLQTPYRNGINFTPQQHLFNTSMSNVRVSVEWAFREIVQNWGIFDSKRKLKIGLSAVAKFYLVATLLRNALTCFYGSQISTYFNLEPPNVRDYFL